MINRISQVPPNCRAGIHASLAVVILVLSIISLSDAWAQATSPRTISDITALLDQYKPDPKLAEQNRARAYAETPANLSGNDLAKFLHARSWAAEAIGDSKRQIADLRSAIELMGGSSGAAQQYRQDLSNALLRAGNYLEGVRIREELSEGTTPGRLLSLNSPLVTIYQNFGDEKAARIALQRAESGYTRVSAGKSRYDIAMLHERNFFIERARAAAIVLDGKYDQAETMLRRAVREAELYIDDAEGQIASNNITPGNTPESHREIAANHLDYAEFDLSAFLVGRNRPEEAELLLRKVLQRNLARLGRDNVRTARVIRQFAAVLWAQGRYHEALQMALAAVAAFERAGAVPAGHGLTSARRTLAAILVSQERWTEAITAYEEMRGGLANDAESLAALGKGDASWGLALVKTGRFTEAVALLDSRVNQDVRVLGESHPEVALNRGVLAIALARSGDKQRALADFATSVQVLLDRNTIAERTPAQTNILRQILQGYIDLLFEIRGTEMERVLNVDAAEEAFRLADSIRGQRVQAALAASSARATSGDPGVAALVRKEQDLGEQTRSLYTYLLNQLSLPVNDQSPKILGEMRKRIDDIAVERKSVQAELQRRYPRYSELVNPRRVTLADARAALRDGEVLLSILVTDERTCVWVVPKQGPLTANVVSIREEEIARVVGKLRRALDPGDVAIDRMPEFEVNEAAKLYEALLKPVASAWQDARSLLVVTNGALAQLPFGILPTAASVAPPDQLMTFERYKAVPWIIKQIAVTQLPAINTLVTLRALPAGNAARTAFAGFGDPLFGAQTPPQAEGKVAMRTRNLGVRRVTEAALRDGSAPASYLSYAALPPLPDTREEILSIAAATKADVNKDVFLGSAASKHNAKSTDLSKRRVIAFATHGLIPGDFPNLDQPALALASADGTPETGLLTLEDILALKLDADMVVLSACNTAAGEGAGAEAISGLGRGFFYAGSRSLLVTHWPVETRSARILVTGIFERYTADAKITRAEALRQSMISVMDDKYIDPATQKPVFSYAHPIFWAPYAIVGDGGAH